MDKVPQHYPLRMLRFWQRNGFGFHRAIAAQAFGTRTHTRSELRKALGAA